jgi:hypothetical protein
MNKKLETIILNPPVVLVLMAATLYLMVSYG